MSKAVSSGLFTRRALAAAVVLVTIGSGALWSRLAGQNAAPASAATAKEEFQSQVYAVVADKCMTCHNDGERAGEFSMEAFADPAAAVARRELWEKAHDKVASGKMPPRSGEPLTAAERATLMGWIERHFGVTAVNADPATADPGRVTARRLNRLEYNNTIRDLLGVTLKPADEFPVDDSGYGFDNIGDVLTISPMLMEKYMRAARLVSRAAVFGEDYPDKPGRLVQFQAKKIQDDTPATGTVAPFAIRGSLDASYHFPVTAEYEIRWRYVNFRGDDEPVQGDDAPPGAAPPAAGRGGRGARGVGAGAGAAAPQATPAANPAASNAPAASPQSPSVTGGAPNAPAAPQSQPAAGAAGNPPAPPAQTTPAGRGARGGGRGRVPLTPEEYAAREEALRLQARPEPMVLTVDGVKVYEYVVEGSGNFNYTHPDNVHRMRLTAGDHELRVSYPGLANVADPRTRINRDGRRSLFIDYLDILGPFNPSKEPPAGFAKIFICGAPGKYSAQCTRQIVTNLVTRAYRRPATPQEVQRLTTLVGQVQRQDSFEEGIRVAIEAILMSPQFLFRIERDQSPVAVSRAGAPALAVAPQSVARTTPAASGGDGSYRISDYELASRLSYFLWSSMPDDRLFDLARTNKLRDKAVLDAEVKRMLADPKAESLVENFAEQWLNLRLMDRTKPDATMFKQVDDELLGAMRTETRMFVGSIITEDRSILDLIDGRFTFVNGPLARYYGIKGVDGEAFQRVELDGAERSGILTQGAILAISSYATRTSPVIRGKWVLDNLLGAPPPPPPDNIPALVDSGLGTAASMRERLAQHRANPACAACHNQMDPIGLSLENYDAAGAWRTKEGNFDIDASGTLPDGRKIVGAQGLKEALRERPTAFAEHFTDRLLTYALGRGLEKTDRPVLMQIATELGQNNYRFSTLVSSIVNSRPFQMRSKAVQ